VSSNNAASFQWQRSSDEGATWSDVAGATNPTLTSPALGLIDSGTQYRVRVTNALGTVNSDVARVTVKPFARLLAGAIGGGGHRDGPAATARFLAPRGILAANGSLYAVEENHVVRQIAVNGTVTTIAGVPDKLGTRDGPALSALFSSPRSIAIDGAGTLWVVDQRTCALRRIAGGQVSLIVGALNIGGCWRAGSPDGADPSEIAVSPTGELFVSDRNRHVVRRIDSNGTSTVYAGAEMTPGSNDGPRTGGALLRQPRGLAFDPAGNLYVVDSGNVTLRRIAVDGTVTTIAGTAGQAGHVDAIGPSARFAGPRGLAIFGGQRLVITDVNDHTIRQMDLTTGAVSTLAGTAFAQGAVDGLGPAARFDAPIGVTVDTAGVVYVADTNNHMIRRISPNGAVTTLAGQPDPVGATDGTGGVARFGGLNPIASDSAGNIYMADVNNLTVRKITPAGVTTTIAGAVRESGSQDGPGSTARFRMPSNITIDGVGNLFVSDLLGFTIRRINPSGNVQTIAGVPGVSGYLDGPAPLARLGEISHLAADGNGNVVFSEFPFCRIRHLSSAGIVSTLVDSEPNCGLVDGPVAIRRVGLPSAFLYEPSGDIVFVNGDVVVRRLKPDGSITTIAGAGKGFADGPGSSARFEFISALTRDAQGRIYVADSGNHAIRLIALDGTVTTLVARGLDPIATLGSSPSLRNPTGIALLPSNGIAVTSEVAVLLH
jgi:sugar lactone lactonase YvrE